MRFCTLLRARSTAAPGAPRPPPQPHRPAELVRQELDLRLQAIAAAGVGPGLRLLQLLLQLAAAAGGRRCARPRPAARRRRRGRSPRRRRPPPSASTWNSRPGSRSSCSRISRPRACLSRVCRPPQVSRQMSPSRASWIGAVARHGAAASADRGGAGLPRPAPRSVRAMAACRCTMPSAAASLARPIQVLARPDPDRPPRPGATAPRPSSRPVRAASGPRAHGLGHRQRLLQRAHRRRPLPQHRLQRPLERGDRALPDQPEHPPAETAPPVGLEQRQQLRRPGPIADRGHRVRQQRERHGIGGQPAQRRRAAPPGSGGRRPRRPGGRTIEARISGTSRRRIRRR